MVAVDQRPTGAAELTSSDARRSLIAGDAIRRYCHPHRTSHGRVSLPALVWVMNHSEAELGPRLVLLVLAEHSHDDGSNAFPSVETICRRSRLSRRSVQNALRRLESDGMIERAGIRDSGTIVYQVVMAERGGAESTPPPEEGGADHDVEGAQITTRGGADLAPDPSMTLELDPSVPPISPAPKMVARQRVSREEEELSTAILGEWNRQAGQRLTGSDWHIPVIGRIREHPELGIAEHAHVIATALDDPWWDGPTNPSVVYGNGRQFDRCLLRVTNGAAEKRPALRYGRGLTVRDALSKIQSGEARAAAERINRDA